MFGTFRFILAVLVALSHFGFRSAAANPGMWAVLGFYALSGYLMQYQAGKLGSWFLPDRMLRLLPLFWVTLAGMWIFLPAEDVLLNLSLLPLAYLGFAFPAIDPTWSLAVEFHFYLLTPLLFRLSDENLKRVGWASVAVFAASPFLPNSNWWSYGGPVGALFVYVAGMLMARGTSMRGLLPAMAALLALCVLGKLLGVKLPTGTHIGMAFGVLLAIPLVQYLASKKETPLGMRLGALTYPLFLVHEPLRHITGWTNPAALLAISVVCAWLAAELIEKPADKLRYRLRRAYENRSGVLARRPAA